MTNLSRNNLTNCHKALTVRLAEIINYYHVNNGLYWGKTRKEWAEHNHKEIHIEKSVVEMLLCYWKYKSRDRESLVSSLHNKSHNNTYKSCEKCTQFFSDTMSWGDAMGCLSLTSALLAGGRMHCNALRNWGLDTLPAARSLHFLLSRLPHRSLCVSSLSACFRSLVKTNMRNNVTLLFSVMVE